MNQTDIAAGGERNQESGYDPVLGLPALLIVLVVMYFYSRKKK